MNPGKYLRWRPQTSKMESYAAISVSFTDIIFRIEMHKGQKSFFIIDSNVKMGSKAVFALI